MKKNTFFPLFLLVVKLKSFMKTPLMKSAGDLGKWPILSFVLALGGGGGIVPGKAPDVWKQYPEEFIEHLNDTEEGPSEAIKN